MDDISREPLPEHSGQGVVAGGGLRKGPAELARFVGDSPIDGLPEQSIDERVHGGGSAQREELLMVLDGLPEGLQPEDEQPEDEQPDDDLPENLPPDELPEDLPADGLALDELTEEFPDEPLQGPPAPDPHHAHDREEEVDAPIAAQADAALTPDQLPRVLCGILLANREPVSLLRLAEAAGSPVKAVREGLVQLGRMLEHSGLPLEVAIHGEQVTLMTAPDIFDYVRRLRAVRKPEKLSSAALETLAVIAYRQPVMRAEIEAIRGVKAGPILKTLLEHRMIKSVGRADVPGRPLQYGTTQHFLESFGLESLKDLPSVKEFRAL